MLKEKDIAAQRAANARVLELMDDCGADMERLHAIEHFMYAPTEETAKTLAAEAKAAGYGEAQICESNYGGKTSWLVFLTREALPKDADIDNESIFLASLCEKHGATYDGWGTGMIGDDLSLDDLPGEPLDIDLDDPEAMAELEEELKELEGEIKKQR